MKISFSRRMKAFMAKWGGLILAAVLVLPLAGFGGTYLYANSRVDDTLTWVTQEITLNSFLFAGVPLDPPRRVIYHIVIGVHNRTPDAAQVNITGARVKLNEVNYDIVGSAGWQGTVAGKDDKVFEGDIVLPYDTYLELINRTLDLEVTGNIKATAHYSFVDKEAERPIKITTEVIFPPPSTSPPP